MEHRVSSLMLFALLAGFAALGAPRTVRAQEGLAVIVNRQNPVNQLSMDELRKFCMQESKHWDDNKRVTIVLRDPGQVEREAVLNLIYHMSESEFNRHFLKAQFTGEVQTAPKHLSSAAGVRRFVFNVPGALGFTRASEVDSSVKVIRVDGFALDDPHYPLRLPSR
jgi:phosphate transport system substrate-binding protein